MDYIQSNWATLLIILSAGANLFSAVAAITKTKKDDKIARKVKDFIVRFLSIK